ncbi:MAG: hypothetical protein HNEKOMLI_00619 [Sodalis sp. Psp]|nr:hypothetical protein [Sodalis sp. Psp]MCR3757086.1 hypothetical protein [Sodalis sp. Ppy]
MKVKGTSGDTPNTSTFSISSRHTPSYTFAACYAKWHIDNKRVDTIMHNETYSLILADLTTPDSFAQ